MSPLILLVFILYLSLKSRKIRRAHQDRLYRPCIRLLNEFEHETWDNNAKTLAFFNAFGTGKYIDLDSLSKITLIADERDEEPAPLFWELSSAEDSSVFIFLQGIDGEDRFIEELEQRPGQFNRALYQTVMINRKSAPAIIWSNTL